MEDKSIQSVVRKPLPLDRGAPNGLFSIYKKLYKYFGPQHWWPADSEFEVMLGAILTQNTNWQNVEKAIMNLKRNNLINAKKLYKLPLKKLACLIRSSGYYNIKSKRIKNFLRFFIDSYHASFKKMFTEDAQVLRDRLLSVKGIGKETADSILLYALNKPIFVVDAYTKRIFSRHGIIKEDSDYDEIQNLLMKNLKKDVKLFNEYHALLVRLGKEFCLKKRPRCEECPLK